MVDMDLVKEVNEMVESGSSDAAPDATLKIYEMIKQISDENEDLKEEMEDMDIEIQMILTDTDKKYWVKVKGGTFSYGEGETDSPSFTLKSTTEVGAGILFGEVDATSAYMAGDITVEGNLQDAMAYQESNIESCFSIA
jgi:putative sterol carrier protein